MALEQVHPASLILALRSFLANTPISPRVETAPERIQTVTDLEFYMAELGERIQWVVCPRCKREWNNLTPSGDCIGCVDEDQAREKLQTQLGEYLRKVLGGHGLATYRYDSYQVDDGNRDAYEACVNFIPERQSLMLWGPSGVGKTHLAGAVLKAMAGRGKTLKWLNPMYVSRFMKGRWPDEEERAVNEIVAADVVVFDDLGKSRDIEATIRLIYEVLDKRRMEDRHGVVITSNLSIDQLAKAFRDDRIASRIGGACRNHIFQITGSDHRI